MSNLGMWCKGSRADFEAVGAGSIPAILKGAVHKWNRWFCNLLFHLWRFIAALLHRPQEANNRAKCFPLLESIGTPPRLIEFFDEDSSG